MRLINAAFRLYFSQIRIIIVRLADGPSRVSRWFTFLSLLGIASDFRDAYRSIIHLIRGGIIIWTSLLLNHGGLRDLLLTDVARIIVILSIWVLLLLILVLFLSMMAIIVTLMVWVLLMSGLFLATRTCQSMWRIFAGHHSILVLLLELGCSGGRRVSIRQRVRAGI